MNLLIAAVLGALTGLGLLLILNGIRGNQLLPEAATVFGDETSRAVALAAAMGALVVGVLVYLVTGWPVAAFGIAIVTLLIPRNLGSRRAQVSYVERTNAIASWTEMIRDNMAGAAGLEQALQASAELAPEVIRPELRLFARNLDRMSLVEALHRLGDELKHPSADLVVAALANAAVMEVRELGPLLGRLAEATRADTRMRERVEVGRARIRTSARIVVVTTVITIVVLWVFAGEILAAYDSAAGQIWMCVVGLVFVAGGLALRHFSNFDVPDRFAVRRRPTPSGAQLTADLTAMGVQP